MKLSCYLIVWIVSSCFCYANPAASDNAGFYSSDPDPSLRFFGDETGGPSSKSAGVVYVLSLQSNGEYSTNEYQIYDGRAVTVGGFGVARQCGDQGKWTTIDSRVVLTSVRCEPAKEEAILQAENGASFVLWHGIKYLKRSSDTIEPLLPLAHWKIDFGGECWKIESRYYGAPYQPIIVYAPCDVDGKGAAFGQRTTLTETYEYGKNFETTSKMMEKAFTWQRFGIGPRMSDKKVIFDRPEETLYECYLGAWTRPRSENLIPASYELRLLKHDLVFGERHHLWPGVFSLKLNIPLSQLTEEMKVRWIDRLRRAKLE